MTIAARGAATVALMILVTGCAGPSIESSTQLDILETRPANGVVHGADLFPLDAAPRTFEIVGVDTDPPAVVAVSAEATDRFEATMAVRMGDRTEYRRRDADGTIRSPAVIDHRQRALTRFDPPLTLAPATLTPGTPVTEEVAMRVLDARNPKRVRESGHATRTIEYVDDQRLRTPWGDLDAKRVVVTFEARLRLARADTRTTLWVTPGRGVVAREDEERLRVLGLPTEPKIRRLVLAEDRP